jgi:hypothetical protein
MRIIGYPSHKRQVVCFGLVTLWFSDILYFMDVPKLVIQKPVVVTSELDVTIWSGMFQKSRLFLKI